MAQSAGFVNLLGVVINTIIVKINKTTTRSCLGVAEQDNILARVAKKIDLTNSQQAKPTTAVSIDSGT